MQGEGLGGAQAPPRRLFQIPGFRGYAVDLDGGVWSAKRRRFRGVAGPYLLTPWRCPEGYCHVTLDLGGGKRKRIAVHNVVMLALCGPRPRGYVIAHLNGDRTDNRLLNLAYVTQRVNIAHKWLHGTMRCGDRSHLSRLSDDTCRQILQLLEAGTPRRAIARRFGVGVGHVYALRSGRIRRHLTGTGLTDVIDAGPFFQFDLDHFYEGVEAMKNYIQPGKSVTVTAPAGGASSGDGVLIGSLFGVAQHDAADGAELELLTEGVVELAKTAPLAIAAGDRLFWDATNKELNKTATAQVCVGIAVADAADADTIVRLKLVASTPVGT